MVVPALDVRVPLGRPLPELAGFARRCEDAGLSGVGVPDHHHVGRDAYAALAAMAGATDRLTLYPATSNVVTRHPLVLAALANSLDELAPGRSLLTVAPGFLSVEKAGEPQARREQLGRVVQALRRLLGDGRATYDGHELELFHRPATGSRVVVLASGPRLLELAGEVADRLPVDSRFASGRGTSGPDRRVPHERAGRDPAELEEILIVPFGLGDAATTRGWVQGWFREGQPWLRYPSASNLRWLREAGIDLPDDYDPADVDDSLADRVLDAYGLFGSPEHCAERLQLACAELDPARMFLFPAHSWETTYDLPGEAVAAAGSHLVPALEELS
ncbi:LLM class flavin-dependent oxidoreductase [Nocardioides sp. GXQ0305]|uniref:LLM class flavin-dependent oxidoreductase n=1 Tax=Nocardioides sp. GXQ0305 TaxID=3423912 RepID=UPI003D7CC49A